MARYPAESAYTLTIGNRTNSFLERIREEEHINFYEDRYGQHPASYGGWEPSDRIQKLVGWMTPKRQKSVLRKTWDTQKINLDLVFL